MVLRLNSHGNDVRKLQQALLSLNYQCGAVDGVFGGKVEDAVEAFQRDHDLYSDGVAGPLTLKVLDRLVAPALRFDLVVVAPAILSDPDTGVVKNKKNWVKCPADALGGGYNNTTLREDVSVAYNDLYAAAHALGGVVTSAGGKRALDSGAGPNRSRTSMHYVGRAFDMATGSALQNPVKDAFLLERVGDTRFWTVWCKSNLSEAALIEACKVRGIRGGFSTIPAVFVTNGKIKTQMKAGLTFDFTALAAQFGFSRISARKAFWDKADPGAAEWWHWSYLQGLVEGTSTFGTELLKVYTPQEAQAFAYWAEAKGCTYGVDWN